jgi:hypothetical protein
MSVYSLVIAREYDKGIRDAQSRNEKWIYFMLSNNKFLGKCGYGRYPWIRLAVECESMVEKGINFIFMFGTRLWYILHWKCWELLGHFRWWEKYATQFFLSLNLSFELWNLYKSLLPSVKGLSIYFMQFLFLFESPFSLIKHQLRDTMIILEHWM